MPIEIVDDLPPNSIGSDSSIPPTVDAGTDLVCVVCGVPLIYGGRGKKPKYCADHRRQQSSSRPRTVGVDALIDNMTQFYGAVGVAFTFVPNQAFQLDGMAVSSQASKLAESWRPLIIADPKVRKMWERITTGSGWGAVVMAHAIIGMSIAANHGVKLPGMPTAPVVQPTVTEDYGNE